MTQARDIRKQLEAEGWGWVEINPERDYDFIHRCSRLQPHLMGAPAELLAQHEQAKDAVEAARQEDDFENDDSGPEVEAAEQRLDRIEEQLSAYIGFDATQKALAGCYVSIGPDGTEFLDKGLVKPEHRKALAGLLKTDDGRASATPKPKNPLSESLRSDLAAYRCQIAQVELCRHTEIAFDLLVFHVASRVFGNRRAQR